MVAFVVAGELLFVNLFGNAARFDRRHDLYGWPLTFAPREMDSLEYVYGREWIRYPDLMIDLFAAPLILLGTTFKVERWCRRQRIAPRLGLRVIFAAIAWIACYLSVQRKHGVTWEEFPYRRSEYASPLAVNVCYVSLARAWLAFFDAVGAAWTWLADNRRKATGEP